jgi:integrase
MKVQQGLLRHADIRTTMNIYTAAVDEEPRKAHGEAVGALLSGDVKPLMAPEIVN